MRISFVLSWGCLLAIGGLASSSARTLDRLKPGDSSSETEHALQVDHSEVIRGGLGEQARRLLPGGEKPWQGGWMRFRLKVDPQAPNYLTLRLWGDEVNPNLLLLRIEGKQVGYRHLGDYEALELGSDTATYPGRFVYRTTPIPLELTQGKESLEIEIQSTGRIWGYGKNFDQYQQKMTQPTRGIYGIYSHTEGYFEPDSGEKQGVSSIKPAIRNAPGPEVLEKVKERVNGEIQRLLKDPKRPANQMQLLFLAKAYHLPWTQAAGKAETLTKAQATLDQLYRSYVANPKLAQEDPATYNPDWFGLGPSGWALSLLKKELGPGLDEEIDDGKGVKIKRRDAYRQMWMACRDWHRENRRLYTNQSMINDLYGIYAANLGIAAVDPAAALPAAKVKRYLEESVGLEPWLGSEKNGVPQKPQGDAYFQLTRKGLTRELGFVGNYGEVIDWVVQIYEATRPEPEAEGDARLKEQLIRIARARAPFRYPLSDEDGYPAMVQETVVGWRDVHFPGNVTYTQRPTFDSSPLEVAAVTLDPVLVGGVQQMMKDNQLFVSLEEKLSRPGFRETFGMLSIPADYERLKSQPVSSVRLPMSADQPDFVFADEEDGVVAVKHGKEILYASLYWRARYGINFLGRVHYLTPELERVATVREEVEYTPSGMTYERPNWTNFGFAKGGMKYPDDPPSAHRGEKLPVAKIPEGVAYQLGQESLYAGRGDFYQMTYGPYRIAMNVSADRTFEVQVPSHSGQILELVGRRSVKAGEKLKVAPRTTVVLRLK